MKNADNGFNYFNLAVLFSLLVSIVAALPLHSLVELTVKKSLFAAVDDAMEHIGVEIKGNMHPFEPFNRIVLADAEVCLNGNEPVFVADRICIDNTLYKTIRFFSTFSGNFNIGIYGGTLNVNDRTLPGDNDGLKNVSAQPAAKFDLIGFVRKLACFDGTANIELRDFSADCTFSDEDMLVIGKSDLKVSANSKLDVKRFDVSVPFVTFRSGSVVGEIRDIVSNGDTDFNVSEFAFNSDNINFDLKNISGGFRKDVFFFINLDSIPINFDDKQVNLEDVSFDCALDSDRIAVNFRSADNRYRLNDRFGIGLSDLLVSYTLGEKTDGLQLRSSVFVSEGEARALRGELALDYERDGLLKIGLNKIESPYLKEAMDFAAERRSEGVIHGELHSGGRVIALMDLDEKGENLSGSASVDLSGILFPGILAKADIGGDLKGEFDFSFGRVPGMRASMAGDVNVFGTAANLDLCLNSVDGKESISGSGISVGKYNIRPYASLDPDNEPLKIDFEVSDTGKLVAAGAIQFEKSLINLDIGSTDGEYSCELSAEVYGDNKRAEGRMDFFDNSYQFVFSSIGRGFHFECNGMTMDFDYENYLNGKLEFNDFIIPDFTESNMDNVVLNAKFDVTFIQNSKELLFKPAEVRFGNNYFSAGFSAFYNDKTIRADDFFLNSSSDEWKGWGFVSFPDFEKGFYRRMKAGAFADSNPEQSGDDCLFSMQGNGDSADFMLKLSGIRFPGWISRLDLNLISSTDFDKVTSLFGNIRLFDKDELRVIDTDIVYNGSDLSVSDSYFHYGNLKVDGLNIRYNSADGSFSVGGDLDFLVKNLERDRNISCRIECSGNMDRGVGFADILKNGANFLKADLDVKQLNLDEYVAADIHTALTLSSDVISFSSPQISGNFNLKSGEGSLSLADNMPVQGDFFFKNDKNGMDIRCDIRKFPLFLANIFIFRPIVKLGMGELRGKAHICGNLQNPEIYCSLFSDYFGIWNFWDENEEITINNAVIVGYGHEIKLLRTSSSTLNRKLDRMSLFEVEGGCSFENMKEPYWYFKVHVPEGQYVSTNIPILPMNYNIDVQDASGELFLEGFGMDFVRISGDFFGNNAVISTPMRADDWVFGTTGGGTVVPAADVDVTVTCGDNVRFVYPDSVNPFINAKPAAGQKVRLVYYDSTNEFYIDGNLTLAEGEIQYFKRRFFIEHGSVSWPLPNRKNELKTTDDGPVINLQASLRDFDNDGNAVDLYINLINATLNNIHPVFTSSVPMSETEIMMRIGQSAFETKKEYGNVEYLTNLSTMAIDLFSNFGILRAANPLAFTENFGLDLGLDIFVLRTNLLYNFLSDASSTFFNQNSHRVGNAFSRYLDGTFFNAGKLVRENMLLGLSLEFINTAGIVSNRRGFEIASDLYCLFTLSCKWSNPLADFTFFSQLSDFSIAGFLSGIGISVQKTVSL